MIDDFLLQVRKPGRYIGNEWNVIKKDPNKCDIKFALCFPDLYELGMSHLGFRIIYGLLNEQEDILCERVFALANDFENKLREKNIPLFSLENRIPLKDFDIIGFSLNYELNYTNVLNMLELGQVPIFSKQRTIKHPLVIGGGNCTLNPEPLVDFFDLFLIGDAEEGILEITDVYKNYKGKERKELLEILSGIEGVYVPSLYSKQIVKKRVVKDLNKSYFPKSWLVPYIEIVHDRISLEIARGCPHQCSFCQARVYYWPYREKSPDLLKEQAISLYKNTGYEEISLMGLSSSDYSRLKDLINGIYDFCFEHKIAMSFPSMRPKLLLGDIGHLLSKIKKTTITFAPETANCQLRQQLNKNLKIDELINTAEKLFEMGYLHIKLYFMIGLPKETDDDLEKIVDLCLCLLKSKKKINKKIFLNLSISNFIPKPHTVLQWEAFKDMSYLKEKQAYLRKKIRKISKYIKLSFNNPESSMLEAILSRGDATLGNVIYSAFKNGAKFDASHDYFNFSLWQNAFKENAIDMNKFLGGLGLEKMLPWDFISTGLSKDNLKKEYELFFNN